MNDNDIVEFYCSGKVTYGYCGIKFAELPSAGIWKDRKESDEELLEVNWELKEKNESRS